MSSELCPLAFGPRFESADLRERLVSRRYTAVWLENIVAPDEDCVIEYEYIIIVFPRTQADPVLFLTAEKNASYQDSRKHRAPGEDGGSHFLCMFDAEGHHNFGASDAWCDPLLFRTEAVNRIAWRTGERLEPRMSPPGGRRQSNGRG